MTPKVIVGMSGGVDSSVAAYLLTQQNYKVEGLFMKNWETDDSNGVCPAEQDLKDAQLVCEMLNIPLHSVNFSKEYWDNVFSTCLDAFAKGLTPNPDILCNKEIKFKIFLEHAKKLGADYIATGHYAKIKNENEHLILCKSKDRSKDQTYFLHAIDPQILKYIMFPLSDLLKSEVRLIAQKINLHNCNKKDSTGICFIGEKQFKPFLNEFLLSRPGDIITTEGKKIGRHDGIMFYTIGQRQGLGIGGTQDYPNEPWYVVNKCIETNTIMVAQNSTHPLLYSKALFCQPIHWLIEQQSFPLEANAKIRYQQNDEPCIISHLEDNKHCVLFANPQRAVTPGQSIVFYIGDHCVGGAIITDAIQ